MNPNWNVQEFEKKSPYSTEEHEFQIRCRTYGNETSINSQGNLVNFKGKVTTEADPTSIGLLTSFMDKYNKTCLPSSLEIRFDATHPLNGEMIKALLNFTAASASDIPTFKIPFIYLDGLKSLDLSDPSLSPQEKLAFLQLVFRVECPDLKEMVLADPFSDDDINRWIKEGRLQNIESLNLEKCQSLTSDLIAPLAKFVQSSKLRQLSLSENLKVGTRPLTSDFLPTLTNPFLINQLYVKPSCLRSLARSLYQGPTAWASIFQIPLSRAFESNLFIKGKDFVLDPQSVACWLYQKDYENLKAVEAITTLIADYCKELNDENLIPFIQKFPNLTRISLYGCPHISVKGLEALRLYNDGRGKAKILNIEASAGYSILDSTPLGSAKHRPIRFLPIYRGEKKSGFRIKSLSSYSGMQTKKRSTHI